MAAFSLYYVLHIMKTKYATSSATFLAWKFMPSDCVMSPISLFSRPGISVWELFLVLRVTKVRLLHLRIVAARARFLFSVSRSPIVPKVGDFARRRYRTYTHAHRHVLRIPGLDFNE